MIKIKKLSSMRLDWIKAIILLYLYAPVFLFLITWVKLYLAVPTIIFSLIMLFLSCKKDKNINTGSNTITKSLIIVSIVTILFLGLWAILSGLGGFTKQTGDWKKHNVLLRELIDSTWPVRYDFNGDGVMSYYIAGYLIPAMFGKLSNFDTAQIVLLVWVVFGLFISCVYLYRIFGKNKPCNLLIIALSLFSFATFIIPLSGIYMQWEPLDAGGFGHWISKTALIQYSSNITLLRWVFPQFIPTLVVISLFMKEKNNTGKWLPLATPLVLYSTFTFLGLIVIMAIKFILDIVRNNKNKVIEEVKLAFSIVNLLSIPLLGLLLVYIAGNILQAKPDSAGMNFGMLTHKNTKLALVFFELSWMIWFFILYRRERKNSLFWVASIVLFILPFFTMGRWNDLCMRASIPALLIFNCLIIKNIINTYRQKNSLLKILFISLIITGLGSFGEIRFDLVRYGIDYRRYDDPFAGNTIDFYYFEPNTLYQYISWEPDKFLNKILQK